ncbi:MAG TPA: hypothetical protein DEG06_08975 [Lachnospiraceae bacterium]|jgi:hypothetical protein|nr:hypothetical protein [Lachnospiraceae bacterium]HBI72608.1 hypothetical protein [Lachnospiraceae bacterium]HBY72357.1 hypothetical protein [Lachnospiraceae bacterium]HCA70275.1 hypothetical protein [Lachnospiraceae bacterium]HCM11801.1 hypothetical protein [Lachnospiraceae bacterium]
MQQYQFEKIYSQMEKEFGKLKSGEEEAYAMILMSLESNVLKIHRKYPSSNSRRLKEALALTLFDIKERYTGEKINTDSFRDNNNERLEQALLMAFDPFTNEEVKEVIAKQTTIDLSDTTQLHDYYAEPIRCLLRIKESVDTWEKQMGSNGYFDFIEQFMGEEIHGDEMKFSILASVL